MIELLSQASSGIRQRYDRHRVGYLSFKQKRMGMVLAIKTQFTVSPETSDRPKTWDVGPTPWHAVATYMS